MITIIEKDRDKIIELLHDVEFSSNILNQIKSILYNAPLKETYQYYDEDDKFIGEKERTYLRVMRDQGCPSYPIDDGSGVYFDDGKKGLCVLSSRVAVWTLRHYSYKYFI